MSPLQKRVTFMNFWALLFWISAAENLSHTTATGTLDHLDSLLLLLFHRVHRHFCHYNDGRDYHQPEGLARKFNRERFKDSSPSSLQSSSFVLFLPGTVLKHRAI